MSIKNCNICDELYGRSGAYISELLKGTGILNANLAVTENLAIIPSIGPLVYGHSLIVTRIHSSNVLINALDGNYLTEIDACLSKLSDTFLDTENRVLLLAEHGTTIDGCDASLCSTTHGHVHAIPLNRYEADFVLEKSQGWSNDLSLVNICKGLRSRDEYCVVLIYEKNGCVPAMALFESKDLQPQMVRRFVGEATQNPKWDWHLFPHVHTIAEMISAHFNKNQSMDKLGTFS